MTPKKPVQKQIGEMIEHTFEQKPLVKEVSQPIFNEITKEEVKPIISESIEHSFNQKPLEKEVSQPVINEIAKEDIKPSISESIEHSFEQRPLEKEMSAPDYKEFKQASPKKEISTSIEHGFDQAPLMKFISSPEVNEVPETENVIDEIAEQKKKLEMTPLERLEIIEDDNKEEDDGAERIKLLKYAGIGFASALSIFALALGIKKMFSKKKRFILF